MYYLASNSYKMTRIKKAVVQNSTEQPKEKATRKKKEGPVFDITKQYNWNLDSKFPMLGNDFGAMFSKMNTIMTSDWYKQRHAEAVHILGIQELYRNLIDILGRAVETKVAKEVKESPAVQDANKQ